MANGDGWTSRFLTGLAGHLAVNGVGVWRPDGPAYGADEIGVVIRAVPQSPDRLITLAVYPVDGGGGLADATVGVQHRIRGTTDPSVCDDIADAVFELLDSAVRYTLGWIHVVQSYRSSYASLAQDSNSRWERSDNYYFDLMRPTAHRTD